MTSALAFLAHETATEIAPALAALGVEASPFTSAAMPPAVALVDLPNLDRLDATTGQRIPTIILATPTTRGVLAEVLSLASFTGLIALRTATALDTLKQHLSELLTTEILAGPSASLTLPVRTSTEREPVIAQIEDHLASAGIRQRVIARVINALEELITNALYDAPTDAAGAPLHLTADRRVAVAMASDSYPQLSVNLDQGRIYAAMTDPFGSLSAASFKKFLAHGLRGDFADKAGGAGLGFARIYAAVDELQVRVTPGRSTCVSITLDATAPRRDPATRPNGIFVLERS